MQGRGRLLLVAGLGFFCGCSGPSLDVPGAPRPAWSLELEPASDAGNTVQLFRARVRDAPTTGVPWLFRGELSDYYARALKQGDVPAALGERAVPLRFWREGDDCLLQPLEWLAPDQDYALAFTQLGSLRLLHVSAGTPLTTRLFPPAGSRKSGVSVVCGMQAEAPPQPLLLDPGAVPLQIESAGAEASLAGCVKLSVAGALLDEAVAAPLVRGSLLEPSAWQPNAPKITAMVERCERGQPFHGACLELLDDCVFITPQSDDQLWSVQQPLETVLSLAAGARGVVAAGLKPQSELVLRGQVLSSSGQVESFDEMFSTMPARRHLVLNGVLANPLGPEPAGEWIELLNDSALPASLSQLWLEDAGGHVPLPPGELAPGELALLVGADFRVSGLDVPVPQGVRLLELSSLGARGLSNSGEALLLTGPEGVVSRFPLLAAAHAGHSVARRTPDVADDDPAGFAEHGAPGASPGAANTFDDASR